MPNADHNLTDYCRVKEAGMYKRQKLLSMRHLCAEARNWGRGDDTKKDDQSLQELKPPKTHSFGCIKRKIPSQIIFYEKINLSSI